MERFNMYNGVLGEEREGDRRSTDQEFSKTETPNQKKLWIPSRKNTNKSTLRPIRDLIAKNQRKRKSKKAARGKKSLPSWE